MRNVEEILEKLGVEDLSVSGENIRGCCPVHGGDNPTAFSVMGDKWICFTHECHASDNSITGLIKSVLGCSYADAKKWRYGVDHTPDRDYDDLDILLSKEKKRKNRNKNPDKGMKPIPLDSENIKSSGFFEKQGFYDSTIKKFHVGYCGRPDRPMYQREFIPILDNDGKNIIGVTGRITLECCPICMAYHAQNKLCRDDGARSSTIKWKHYGFSSSNVLFNFCNAKKKIGDKGVLVCTEGPKDAMWFDQNGIENVVAVFGKNVSTKQIGLMSKMGVRRLILAFDNDNAVQKTKQRLLDKLQMFFRVFDITHIPPKGGDFCDVSSTAMENVLLPKINKLKG